MAALNTPAGRAAARPFARVLHDALLRRRADSDLIIPAADLSALLPDPAIAWLGERGAEIVLGRRITALARGAGQWQLATAEGPRPFDAVVCATAPYEAASLLGSVPDWHAWPRTSRPSRTNPSPRCTCSTRGACSLPFAMTGIDGGHAQWLFDREAISGARGLVAAVISASRAEAALDHDVLATAVHRDIERLGATLDPPRWTKVITEKRATFSCAPGAFRPPAATGAPGLVLAGDYTEGPYPATLEAAVQSGTRAARTILGV